MRAGFGQGVSIPSQVRWVDYVDRWVQAGKKYVERSVEIVEVHIWGLREGVKVAVEGYMDDGRTIKTFHVFAPAERFVMSEPADGENKDSHEDDKRKTSTSSSSSSSSAASSPKRRSHEQQSSSLLTAGTADLGRPSSIPDLSSLRKVSMTESPKLVEKQPADGDSNDTTKQETSKETERKEKIKKRRTTAGNEPGGSAVLFKSSDPSKRIILPTNDVNLAIERRTPIMAGASSSSWQVVTAVAHVWFNTYFEGPNKHSKSSNGEMNSWDAHPASIPHLDDSSVETEENNTKEEKKMTKKKAKTLKQDDEEEKEDDGMIKDSGVFEIEWDAMDGIKGTSKRGTRALDRIAIVWKVASSPLSSVSHPSPVPPSSAPSASSHIKTSSKGMERGKQDSSREKDGKHKDKHQDREKDAAGGAQEEKSLGSEMSSSPTTADSKITGKPRLILQPAPGEEIQRKPPSRAHPTPTPTSPVVTLPDNSLPPIHGSPISTSSPLSQQSTPLLYKSSTSSILPHDPSSSSLSSSATPLPHSSSSSSVPLPNHSTSSPSQHQHSSLPLSHPIPIPTTTFSPPPPPSSSSTPLILPIKTEPSNDDQDIHSSREQDRPIIEERGAPSDTLPGMMMTTTTTTTTMPGSKHSIGTGEVHAQGGIEDRTENEVETRKSRTEMGIGRGKRNDHGDEGLNRELGIREIIPSSSSSFPQ